MYFLGGKCANGRRNLFPSSMRIREGPLLQTVDFLCAMTGIKVLITIPIYGKTTCWSANGGWPVMMNENRSYMHGLRRHRH